MTVNICLVGAAGRMGLEIARAAASNDGVMIGSAIDHKDSASQDQDLGQLAGVGPMGISIGHELAPALDIADVVVDLSLPDAAPEVIRAATHADVGLVCGTTGLGDDVLGLFEEAAAKIPVLHTPNLSPGVAVVKELVRRAASALAPEYDIEIVEMHHRHKVDAPSGTALLLADAAAEGSGHSASSTYNYGRQGATGERSTGQIGIHSVRGGGVFGDHTVILAGPNERVEITHRAGTRALFAEGALRAAQFLKGAGPGMYKMADVLGIGD